MNQTKYLIKKWVVLVGVLATQYTSAQNISVSVVSDVVVLTMSGPTNLSNLSSSLNAGNDTLLISCSIGSGTLSLSGSPTGLSVNNTSKTIIVDLTNFNTFSGIELLGSAGNDTVTIGAGGINFLNVNASANQRILIELGGGADFVNVNNSLFSKGNGDISINASRNIVIAADLTAATGGIFLTANIQPTATSGNFIAIDIAADIATNAIGGGDIYIEARGGNSGNNNYGVYLHNGKSIITGGLGAITIIGTGGASTGSNNYGVYVNELNSGISAIGGLVSVTGSGGGTGSSSANNIGVVIDSSGAFITNTGTGSGATISIVGNGGNGDNAMQIGLDIQSEISSSGGNINIEGTGGADAGSFTSNIGILLRASGLVHAGGQGTITALGSASAFQSSCDGILFQDSASMLSDSGSISITAISHSNSFGLSVSGFNPITAGNNQTLTILTNKANLGPLSTGTGTVRIFASPDTADIDMGGTDGIDVLGLSSTELNQISCAYLVIGDTGQSGNIIISNNVNPINVMDSIDLNTSSGILFNSDTLSIGDRSLRINCQSISRDSGMLDASNNSSELILRNTISLSFPQGLLTGAIHKLSINGTGGLILNDSTTITGALALNNGDLSIGNNTLVINGIISGMSAGNSLIGGNNSKLSIGGNGATSIGTIYFSAGTDTLQTLVLNRIGATGSNPIVQLGTNLTITNSLDLTSGKIAIGNQTLTYSGAGINGGNDSSYIQISGSGGLKQQGGSAVLFPVGYNPYLPVVLNCAACSGTDFTVLVSQGVSDQSNIPILTNVVNATWSVLANSNQTADVLFQWPASSELSMPHTSLTLGTRINNLSPWYGLDTGMTINGTDPYDLSFSGFNFSTGVTRMFGIGGIATPLKVQILNLEVDCEQVTWQTTDEVSNSSYEIMGSGDGKEWFVLGQIPASGNRLQINSYAFTLPVTNQDFKFYKLSSIVNTTRASSNIVAANCQKVGSKYQLYPNPTKAELIINGLSEGAVIKLINSIGSLVFESVYDGENNSIFTQELKPGLYILYIDNQKFSVVKTY